MSTATARNHAQLFLKKAEQYLESAEDNLAMERHTPCAGDAIHAGISAKDAIVSALTGSTGKHKDHAAAAKELRNALSTREGAASAERSLRELVSMKAEVEYGTLLVTQARAEAAVRRARSLVALAVEIVRLGR